MFLTSVQRPFMRRANSDQKYFQTANTWRKEFIKCEEWRFIWCQMLYIIILSNILFKVETG
jgi:hypothetical protein